METPNSRALNYQSQIGEEIKRASSIVSTQSGDMMKNIQWYATLVIAEIAGIAKLTPDSHGWNFILFSIAIFSLFVSIFLLVWSNILIQDIKFDLESKFAHLASQLQDIDFSEATHEQVKDIKENFKSAYDVIGKGYAQIYSKGGLITFLIGTVLGGLGLLCS